MNKTTDGHSDRAGAPQQAVADLFLREIVDAEEAAKFLRADVGHVLDLLRLGELSGRRVAGRWLLTRRSLLAYVESGGGA